MLTLLALVQIYNNKKFLQINLENSANLLKTAKETKKINLSWKHWKCPEKLNVYVGVNGMVLKSCKFEPEKSAISTPL